MRVANELGAGNAKGAKFATIVSVITSLAVGILFWLIIMAFHETLAMIFTSSSSVITMVNKYSTLLAFTIPVNCIQPVLSGNKLKQCISICNHDLRLIVYLIFMLCLQVWRSDLVGKV